MTPRALSWSLRCLGTCTHEPNRHSSGTGQRIVRPSSPDSPEHRDSRWPGRLHRRLLVYLSSRVGPGLQHSVRVLGRQPGRHPAEQGHRRQWVVVVQPDGGAPIGFDPLSFPANSNVDQSIVWAVSRFVPHAVTALNLAWMLIVALGGVSATWCLRKLDVSTTSALVAGTLFGLSPYALYRHVVHFWMVIYLVPFGCTAALQLASGRLERWRDSRSCLLLLGGCALIGFNYVYYAFFACFFLLGCACRFRRDAPEARARRGRRRHRRDHRLRFRESGAQPPRLEPTGQADHPSRQAAHGIGALRAEDQAPGQPGPRTCLSGVSSMD